MNESATLLRDGTEYLDYIEHCKKMGVQEVAEKEFNCILIHSLRTALSEPPHSDGLSVWELGKTSLAVLKTDPAAQNFIVVVFHTEAARQAGAMSELQDYEFLNV